MNEEDESSFKKMMEEQTNEIQKHVWIESEKAGRNLYPEAVFDWIKRFAVSWREEYEKRKG